MIKEYLEIGQIVSTHGIRGEVRLNPWCDGPEFVKKFKTLYRDEKGNQSFKVLACRPHGNVAVLKLSGVDTVEAAKALKNTVLFMKRTDVNLPEGKWFISELIGCDVFDADDNNICYGVIKDIDSGMANDIWYINTPDEKEVLIPAIKDVVIKCDVAQNKVFIRPLRGLFDEN
ncbi:MAG: 16S rRNA processing protein RimM [Clostridia bacterium]|nr:16S rRNA processing protein RimM [Clostridia bacterium]